MQNDLIGERVYNIAYGDFATIRALDDRLPDEAQVIPIVVEWDHNGTFGRYHLHQFKSKRAHDAEVENEMEEELLQVELREADKKRREPRLPWWRRLFT
jgi:hypothetical protein